MAPGIVLPVTTWASEPPATANGAACVAVPAGPGLGCDGEQADTLNNTHDSMDAQRRESTRATIPGASGFRPWPLGASGTPLDSPGEHARDRGKRPRGLEAVFVTSLNPADQMVSEARRHGRTSGRGLKQEL